jgi:hypothetical protein
VIQGKNDVQDFCHLVAAMEVLRIKVRALFDNYFQQEVP